MAGPILPPNTAMVDPRNRPTPEWYRYFVNIQAGVNTVTEDVDSSLVLAGIAGNDGFDVTMLDDSGLLSPAAYAVDPEDFVFPPQYVPDVPEDMLPPAPTGLMREEADLLYLAIGSGPALGIRTITATASALASDYTILCDATSGAITVNLPAAATATGRVLNIKKIDASGNAVTIDPSGAELIDGAATLGTALQWDNYAIQCNGTAWYVI